MGSWWDKATDFAKSAWDKGGKYAALATPLAPYAAMDIGSDVWGMFKGMGKGDDSSAVGGVGSPEWLFAAYQQDPEMKAMFDRANKVHGQDYQGLFQGAARQGADTQSRSLSNALAARGGGQLGSALGIGSQARVGAETQGLMAGLGAEQQSQDLMLDALTQRYNILSQIMGGKLGFSTAQLQYKAAREGAQDTMFGDVMKMGATVGAALI